MATVEIIYTLTWNCLALITCVVNLIFVTYSFYFVPPVYILKKSDMSKNGIDESTSTHSYAQTMCNKKHHTISSNLSQLSTSVPPHPYLPNKSTDLKITVNSTSSDTISRSSLNSHQHDQNVSVMDNNIPISLDTVPEIDIEDIDYGIDETHEHEVEQTQDTETKFNYKQSLRVRSVSHNPEQNIQNKDEFLRAESISRSPDTKESVRRSISVSDQDGDTQIREKSDVNTDTQLQSVPNDNLFVANRHNRAESAPPVPATHARMASKALKRQPSRLKIDTAKQIKPMMKRISLFALYSYTISTIFSSLTTICRAYGREDIALIGFDALLAFWIAARLGMFALFITRLYTSFNETTYRYGQKVFCGLYFALSMNIAAFLCLLIFAGLGWFMFMIICGMTFLFLDAMLSFILVYLFVKRLISVIRVMTVNCDKKLSEDKEMIKILKAATKLTNVTLISLSSNLMLLGVLISSGYYQNRSEISEYLANGVFNLLVIINVICVALYFHFGDAIYYRICCGHKLCEILLQKYAAGAH